MIFDFINKRHYSEFKLKNGSFKIIAESEEKG